MSVIRPVILSGGSGTRLWPLSTKAEPKQFVRLIGDHSLFELTMGRLAGVNGVVAPMIVTGASHVEHVGRAGERSGVVPSAVVVEPVGRNTAPAVVAAALVAEPSDVLVVLPSDHLIADVDGFRDAVGTAAAEALAGAIVTFGIVPTRPETGYGYIQAGEHRGSAFEVVRFKEKPALEEAESMLEAGGHSWNSGMFVFTAEVLLAEAETHSPQILAAVRESIPAVKGSTVELGEGFAAAEKISIDHAIMEKTDRAVVIPIDVGWDDVGSYEALWAVSDKDDDGNALEGDVIAADLAGSIVHATSRTVAVAGLSDVVVVETPDSVLVIPRSESQAVRELSERAQAD